MSCKIKEPDLIQVLIEPLENMYGSQWLDRCRETLHESMFEIYLRNMNACIDEDVIKLISCLQLMYKTFGDLKVKLNN